MNTQSERIRKPGFDIYIIDSKIPLGYFSTSQLYKTSAQKRAPIKQYTSNDAHKNIHQIREFLTLKEKNYCWCMFHKLIYQQNTQRESTRGTIKVEYHDDKP